MSEVPPKTRTISEQNEAEIIMSMIYFSEYEQYNMINNILSVFEKKC